MNIMKDKLGRLAVWREETNCWVMYASVRDMKENELTEDWAELHITELPNEDDWIDVYGGQVPVWFTNRLQQVKLLEQVCQASQGELLTALVSLIAQCAREDLSLNNVPNGGMLHTIEIYNLLNQVLGPDFKERDTK